jgi:hypothetical protein
MPKTLADYRITMRTLIQFDIASPFPILLERNRYFLLIIDNYTRTNWVLVLKEKSDANGALEDWKMAVELQANAKIKAARSDNVPEVIQTIEG